MAYKHVLANGLRVVVEPMPHLYSVAAGIWVGIGSCHEAAAPGGVSHVLEHMLFKGTPKRSAKEIAEAMESVGGQMNAFTSKEHTCYYAKCLGEHFGLALDLLADIFLNSLLDEEEFEKEKQVILEEINMYDDTPDDLVHDLFAATLWPDHVYGLPIIGTRESVNSLTIKQLAEYYRKAYLPRFTVVSVAGKIEREQAVEQAARYFSAFGGLGDKAAYEKPQAASANSFLYKDIEQMHLCLGVPGLREDDDDYYAAQVLNAALGGGASSRLFQEAREKRGLTYSIYSYNSGYSKGGYWAAYSSAAAQKMPEVVKVIMNEISGIREGGLPEAELERTKQQVKGNILLGFESTSSVMIKTGKSELARGRVLSVQEMVDKVMAVGPEDIRRVAAALFQKDRFALSTVGPEEIAFDLKSMI
ncbi:MAG: insulinase family protein [Clostridiales bacterium]|nr:insulinase family protein [Clostridiales bacterium]